MHQLSLHLVRYSPDPVKNEFVNIGVLLTDDAGFAGARFTTDWSRVQCIDPSADIETLAALGREIERELAETTGREQTMKRLTDICSNLVQVTPSKGLLAEDPLHELDVVAQIYLESNRRERVAREAGARLRLRRRMEAAFESAGAWKLMQKSIAAADYTRPGDPLKIDCGYRGGSEGNNIVRMFHAIALEREARSASSGVSLVKALAFSVPHIREGVARLHSAQLDFTAIIEDGLDAGPNAAPIIAGANIAFALDALRRSNITIAPAAQLPALAERARTELRA